MYRSDPTLIQGCLDGDEFAWSELVRRYRGLIYSILQRYSLSPDDADDVFQNVCYLILRGLEGLRDQTRLSAWLITTTHRQCWSLGRAKPVVDLDRRIADPHTPPLEEIQRSEQQRIVREAMSRLSPRCQELLGALFLDPANPSYQEISERLGIAVGSIGPTRARCFKQLEAILLEMGFDYTA